MTLFHRLMSMVRWILRRDRAEQDLHDELQTFIELSAADKTRDGVPVSDARRLAALELGGVEPTKERIRTSRHGASLDEIGRDVRYASRMLVKHPGITATVVMTLALGIGANTAIFSLIDALMLRWLPVRNPQELVLVTMQTATDKPSESFSYAIVRALAEQRDIFAGVAGFSANTFDVGPPAAVHRVRGATVTGGFYDTLGLRPQVGRLLISSDDEPTAPPVAVISDGYWEREFARSPDAVGESLLLNGVPVTIVGVSSRGFVGASVGVVAEITLPIMALPRVDPSAASLLAPGNFWLRILARPKSDVSNANAAGRLAAVWPRIAETVIPAQWPASRRIAMASAVFHLTPGGTGWAYMREIYRKPLLVLMTMVLAVLLIACANVASLLLARASARQKEMAVRLAIGASRGRLVRQLLIESLLLSLIGAAVGVSLAWFSSNVLVRMMSMVPGQIEFDLTPNAHVLAFTAAIAATTAILFGVAPALQSTAVTPSVTLRQDSRTGSSRSRWLASLVTAQVALSFVLLVGASLFVRTLENLQTLDPGFRASEVLLVAIDGRLTTGPQELLGEIQAVPGVVSASLSTHTPLSGSTWSDEAVPAGQQLPDRDTAVFVGVGPRFFETMQITLLAGRDFTAADTAGSAAVAVINEQFARRYFQNGTPVGQHLAAKLRGRRTDLEIVAVAKDTLVAGLRKEPPAMVYVSYAQLAAVTSTLDGPWLGGTSLAVRVTGPLDGPSAAMRNMLLSKLPERPIDIRPLSAQVGATLVQERMMATLAGAFGLLALVVACIGLYGLLAYGVARRIKEIGIRMALGAQRRWVVGWVLKGALRLLAAGLAIGVPSAWVAARLIQSMLFGLQADDPAALGGATLLLITIGCAAASFPAWRASRVDPLTAIRHD